MIRTGSTSTDPVVASVTTGDPADVDPVRAIRAPHLRNTGLGHRRT